MLQNPNGPEDHRHGAEYRHAIVCLRVGDRLRFPRGALGADEHGVYRHSWEVVAFRPDGSVLVRRLADSLEQTIAPYWAARYCTEDLDARPAPVGRAERRAIARERALVAGADPRPGHYYVTARDGKRWALVRGPFEQHADALRAVSSARHEAERLDPRAHWYAWGTARSTVYLGRSDIDDDEPEIRLRAFPAA